MKDSHTPPPYIGRFAPSPTGPLHFGSLVTAAASFFDARAAAGRWLVRIEDIDPPREQPGATEHILEALEAHGLCWDGDVLYQSTRIAAYRKAVNELLEQRQAFHCRCSRQQLKDCVIYPGTCRDTGLSCSHCGQTAVRAITHPACISFEDEIQGPQSDQMDATIGDFIIHRKDGFYAYQLAAALDDTYQEITKVVRGQDLMSSTTSQLYLQHQLGLASPQYSHIPVITNEDGVKLSKQTHAPSLDLTQPINNLRTALFALGQEPAPEDCDLNGLIRWGISNWDITKIPKLAGISETLLLRSSLQDS